MLLSVRPGHPRIHLIKQKHQVKGEKITSGFQSLLRRSIEGLSLLAVEKEQGERLIQFSFGAPSMDQQEGFILKVELLGRSSNLILTDSDEKVLGFCRKLKSEFRQPIVGQRYQPPIKPKTSPFQILSDPGLDKALVKDRNDALDFLLDSMKGVSREIAEEIIDRGAEKKSLSIVLSEILERYEKEEMEEKQAYLYSEVSLEDLAEELPLTRKNFIFSPIALRGRKDLVESAFATLNEAAENYFFFQVRNELFAGRKRRIAKMIHREKAKMISTLSNIQEDRKKHEDPERFKNYGEAILAGLKSAKREGDSVEVDDCYRPDEKLKISIDPSISLVQNAERYFKKYRKAERGLLKIDERTDLIKRKIARLEHLEPEILQSSETAQLEIIEERLREMGFVAGIKVRGIGTLDARAEIKGIRIYKSSDGMQILVGKTARDNMKLTFKIASPEDFWLHASGYGGAHVVVKNPSSLKKIPEKTLREAAKLAAFYSSGKREGKVDVHLTKKKYVRKGKNLPMGAVLVKKYEAVYVEPEDLFKEK